jgi:hypothetical protein
LGLPRTPNRVNAITGFHPHRGGAHPGDAVHPGVSTMPGWLDRGIRSSLEPQEDHPVHRRAAILMLAYAVLLIDGGASAYAAAPPDADAFTALLIPSICAVLMLVCAGMTALLGRSRVVGMIGVHLGLILPLLFAIAIGARALPTVSGTEAYREARADFDRLVEADERADTPAAWEAYRADLPEPVADHDKGYLAYALWRLSTISAGTFLVLLLNRPKPAARGGPGSGDAAGDSPSAD